jgi:hypothetical protein
MPEVPLVVPTREESYRAATAPNVVLTWGLEGHGEGSFVPRDGGSRDFMNLVMQGHPELGAADGIASEVVGPYPDWVRRKLRLFSVACARRVQHLAADADDDSASFKDAPWLRAAAFAEAWADNPGRPDRLRRRLTRLDRAVHERSPGYGYDLHAGLALVDTCYADREHDHESRVYVLGRVLAAAHAAAVARGMESGIRTWTHAQAQERLVQAELARCVLGNPWRPPGPWAAPARAVALARDLYGRRRTELLPVLADLLEEAGCADAGLLEHLRGPGPHAGRGCWALDFVLGVGPPPLAARPA